MRLALRASLLAAILGGLLAPVATGAWWPMYTYSNLSHDGEVVFSYVETDLDIVFYCGWGCGGLYCWEEYTTFARATLYLDGNWVSDYWWQQDNGGASAWAYASEEAGVWSLQAQHGLPYVWYQNNECGDEWIYNLYEERFPWPEVTIGSCPVPVNFTMTGHRPLSDGTLQFDYEWESSTGNPNDLGGGACYFREYVYYQNNGHPESPPFPVVAFQDPTINEYPAGPLTGYQDSQQPPGRPADFVKPYHCCPVNALRAIDN